MPRYYFDVREGEDVFADAHGTELPDMRAAIEEARRALADMVRDHFRAEAPKVVSIAIRDGTEGPVILSVSLTIVKPDHDNPKVAIRCSEAA